MNLPDKNIFNDLKHNKAWTKKNMPEFYDWLTTKYSGCNFKESIWLWSHELDSPPTCPICGNKLKYRSGEGYSQYCSKKCMYSDPQWTKNRMKNGSPFSDQEVREKSKHTVQEKYGVDNVFKSEDVQKKIKQTTLERYGVDNVFKSEDVQKRCQENFKKSIEKRKQKQWEELEFIIPDWDSIVGTRTMSEAGIKKHYPKFYEFISNNFPEDMYWYEKIWRYRNHNYNEIKCKTCGKILKFDKYNKKFSDYCSLKCANSNKSKQQKCKKTCLKKYGVENMSQVAFVKDKVKQTNLERYGVEHASQNPEIQKKIKQTNLERYGVEYSSQNPEIQKKVRDTNIERYGVGCYLQLPDAKGYNGSDSGPNKQLAKLLDNHHIKYTREFYIEDRSYDFLIGDTLIEINPTITHNSTWNPWNKPKSKTYHKDKSELAFKNGYECICIWDWDDYNKIINRIITNKQHIGARDCEVRFIINKDAREFLDQYHLQGTIRGIQVSVGLYYQEELVSLMCFGKPRYNKKYQWELLRYCTKPDIVVAGGAQKIMSEFIKKYNPKSIISYCDKSKFSGKIYEKLGFKKINSSISRHWCHIQTHQHITDNMLRQRGFDQIFNTNYGKGTSNEQLMKDHGFLEVWDCGQDTYVLIKSL